MLISFILGYLLVTVVIGLLAARRVKNSNDFAVASRGLPLVMVVTTTFATWFGSETVIGIPSTLLDHGLSGIVEDPFGTGLSLVLVGLFFAKKLYRMSLYTISDFFRQRFSSGIEIVCSCFIMISYLGWVSAQVNALGIVLRDVSGGWLSVEIGVILSLFAVSLYTIYGGMWSVAVTDFVQMILLVVGLVIVTLYTLELTGGFEPALSLAKTRKLDHFWPETQPHNILVFVSAGLTMLLGSIPQQDVFQRVMSAKTELAARLGAIIGGLLYILFAFIPMFLVLSAVSLDPDKSAILQNTGEGQSILPQFIMSHMPLPVQILFFGALLSAIMSTASAALLAPSVTFKENILRYIAPPKDDASSLKALRLTVLGVSLAVLSYSFIMAGSSVYEMVSQSYQVILAATFVPLFAGLYWPKANNVGAWCSVVMGSVSWLICLFFDAEIAALVGLVASFVGMGLGSLLSPRAQDESGETLREH